MSKVRVCLVLAAAAFSGCASGEMIAPPSISTRDFTLEDIAQFFAAVRSSDTLLIYEGLPHHTWEQESYLAERKRADLVRFEGYSFYAKPLAVSEEDKTKLTEIALRKEAHVQTSGLKLCGGFHPDYAVVWKTGRKVSGSLVCFGCQEWKNFTPRGRNYEDVEKIAFNELKAILSKYGASRPKRQDGR